MAVRVTMVRRERNISTSMDVYADSLIAELRVARPGWLIQEISPQPWNKDGHSWRSGIGLRKYYERLWRHPRAVEQLESDIFHILDHSDAHVARWLKNKDRAVVVTCHDLVQFVYPEILKDVSRFPAVSLASWKYSVTGMKHADRVVSVSSNTASDVAQMLKLAPEKITVIPNGVDTYFQPLPSQEVADIRTQYEGSQETFCLLNVGVTQQRKNISTVLRVLAKVSAIGIPVRLWKVGDGFTDEQQNFIQTHNLESMIVLLGKPDKETLRKLYNAADSLIAPSLYEGFGLTVIEAMACGTPVITSNVSSLPEVVGDAAVSVAPLDVDAMAAAVCKIRQNVDYRGQLIEKGILRAKTFTWQNTAQQVADVYETIILEKQRTSQRRS
mgnify:CR=1 FL=1